MATIQYARLIGPGGFSRAVVIKRLHPQFAKDQSFVSMFLDEARLSARIAHANVVQTLDIVAEPSELSVVMEYVHGESLARLLDHVQTMEGAIPVPVAVTLIVGVLHGLHAAHETRGEHGEPLHIVHRDVSPENILVGSDGLARLLDFGIARAQGRSRVTPAGELKGKLAYMAPEQFKGQVVDRRVDVYGTSVLLWEALTGRQLFQGETDAAIVGAVMNGEVPPPSSEARNVPDALDRIVMRGLSRDRDARFATAREMALALENELGIISQSRVSDWLEEVAGDLLRERSEMLQRLRRQANGARQTELEPGTRRLSSDDNPVNPAHLAGTRKVTREPARSGLHVRRSPSALLGVVLALLVGMGGGMWWLARQRSGGPAPLSGEPAPLPTVPAAPAATLPTPASSSAQTVPPMAAPTSPSGATLAPTSARSESLDADDAKVAEPAITKQGVAPAPTSPREPTTPAGHARARRGRTERTPAAKAASERGSRRDDCSDPFTVDALGIRHVKPACLE